LFFFKGTVQKGTFPFFNLFPELFLILKNKNFPDYFGSYNNSALIKKRKKSGAF